MPAARKQNDAPSAKSRSGWSALAVSTRRRYERAGISQADYERGVSLAQARGHSRTPEHPDRAERHPGRYHGYLVGKGRRSINAMTTEGERRITGINARQRSLLGAHANAVRAFLHGNDPGGVKLAAFRRRRLGGFELEADPDRIIAYFVRKNAPSDNFYEDVA